MGFVETSDADQRHARFDAATGGIIYARDEEYFTENVAFLVEDYLFNIPSYALESGSPDLMSKIQSSFGATGKQIRPVVLDGVLRVDFKRLLRVLLPKNVRAIPSSPEEWTSILRLSSLWKLKDVRELAIEKLSGFTMDPTEQIILSLEYNIPGWLAPACEALAARPEILTLQEAQEIGLETAVQVYHMRDRMRPCACSIVTPISNIPAFPGTAGEDDTSASIAYSPVFDKKSGDNSSSASLPATAEKAKKVNVRPTCPPPPDLELVAEVPIALGWANDDDPPSQPAGDIEAVLARCTSSAPPANPPSVASAASVDTSMSDDDWLALAPTNKGNEQKKYDPFDGRDCAEVKVRPPLPPVSDFQVCFVEPPPLDEPVLAEPCLAPPVESPPSLGAKDASDDRLILSSPVINAKCKMCRKCQTLCKKCRSKRIKSSIMTPSAVSPETDVPARNTATKPEAPGTGTEPSPPLEEPVVVAPGNIPWWGGYPTGQ